MARFAVVPIWIGLFVGSASCALAQASPEPSVQVTCEDAAKAARGEQAPISKARGISALGRCPREFGEVIPALWRGPKLSDAEMNELVWESRSVRDRRVFTTLIEVAEGGAAPLDMRLAALTVLATYVEQANGVRIQDLLTARIGDVLPVRSHASVANGEQPLASGEQAAAVELFSRLAATGSPDEMRRAGLYLRQGFIWSYPAWTPLAPGSVAGSWDCAGHLKVDNLSDVDLPLSLVDASGTKFQEFTLHKPGSTRRSSLTAQLTKAGPLAVQFGGRTILNLGCH